MACAQVPGSEAAAGHPSAREGARLASTGSPAPGAATAVPLKITAGSGDGPGRAAPAPGGPESRGPARGGRAARPPGLSRGPALAALLREADGRARRDE